MPPTSMVTVVWVVINNDNQNAQGRQLTALRTLSVIKGGGIKPLEEQKCLRSLGSH